MEYNKEYAKKVYAGLSKRGYTEGDLGSEDLFVARMGKENNRRLLYDMIARRGDANVGSWERFNERMSVPDIDKSQYTFTAEQLGLEETPYQFGKSADKWQDMSSVVTPMGDEVSQIQMPDIMRRQEMPSENRHSDIFVGRESERRFADAAQNLRKARVDYGVNATEENAGVLENAAKNFVKVEDMQRAEKAEQQLRDEGKLRSGVKAGFEKEKSRLYRGAQHFVGEAANLLTGSSLEAQDIIERWDELTGLRNDATAVVSNSDANKIKHINELVKELGSLEAAKEEIEWRANYVTWGDRQIQEASRIINNYYETEGVGAWVGGMIPQMIPAATGMLVSAITKSPTAAKWVGRLGLGGMSMSTAGQSMKEARDYGADNWKVWAVGLGNGAIEMVTEAIPYNRYTKRIANAVGAKVGQELSSTIVNNPSAREELEKLLVKANKELGGNLLGSRNVKDYLTDVAAEGASEFTAEALQTITPMLYQNPEDYPTLWEVVKNGWEGAKGGIFMGSILGGVSKGAEYYTNDQRRKTQGYVRVAEVNDGKNVGIGEVVGEREGKNLVMLNGEVIEVAKDKMGEEYTFSYPAFKNAENLNMQDISFEQGYNTEPTGVNALNAMTGYDIARQEVARALGLAEGDDVDVFLNGRTAEDIANGDEVIEDAVNNYLAQKARMKGIQEKFQQTREQQYEESDRSIDSNANKANPEMTYSTTYEGEEVFIRNGNVVLNEDGTIDVNNSSETLYVKFPDGHVEMISPDKFTEVFTEDKTADLKAAKRAEIDQRWITEFDTAEAQSVEQEKREAGVVFNKTDAQGEHRIEVLNEGENMSDILMDGNQVQIPTEELNRWKQEAGIRTESAVADDTTDNGTPTESEANVAPTGDNVAPVTPVELPDVPDFFRLGGKNYSVASRNADGSVDVIVDGKRETLPAGTDYSSLMPTDKKGDVVFTAMPVERTHEYFVQKVTNDKARALMIEKNRKKAEAERKKFDKDPDVGLDPDKWEEDNRKWEEGKKAAQAKVDYWNEVAKRDAEITRSETREAVENIKPDVMEETADEFIANQLAGIKITPESFKRETGLSNAEQAQLVGVISNDGVSVERAAEIITENYDSELKALGFTGDMQDVRDIIIDVLSQGNPRSYARKGREVREAENVDQQRAEAEAWARGAFDMTLEELYLYEETLLPRMMRDYEGFDENEYYSNLAENNGYDTTRESESIGRSGELLQGEQSVPAGGTPVVGQRNEGGAVHDDVQGGGQNGVAQEEVPVNEPVGETDNSTVSQTSDQVAEGNAPGQSGVDHSLSQEEAQVFITEMEANAEVAPEIELTIENWDSLFGEDGLVETPIGEVKMGENQFTKLMRQGRDGKLGMVKPTLENPDVIIEDESKAKNGETERPSSYVFVKSFKKADGSRYYYFTSVTVSKDGKEVIVSNQEKRRNAIANLLTNGKLVWKHADNVSNASDVANGLYSSQGNSSDLAAEGTDAPQTNVGVNEVYNRHTTAKQPTENVIAELSEPTQSVTASDVSKPQVPEEGGKELLNAETATTSASEDRNSVSNLQENAEKSGEIAENGGERMYSQEELAETKEQLGELNATSAPDFAVRLFSIRPWGALEEANAALKELLASYGETLNGQTTAVIPFLDEAQRLISENGKNQKPRSVEEDLDNGDKRITSYNSRGEVATVAIERDGKVVSVDSYDEGVFFEHTEYDGNGKASLVTRYDKQGNVVGTQVYEDGKAKTPMQKLADRILDRTEEKRRIPLRERARELEAQVGVKANIIESLDEVKNREARERIAAGEPVAGWYSGGQVYLYMPNIKDKREIELTYVHEVVAHHGVKKLLGERFNEFLDGVWNMMSEADRARMLAYVGANENPTLQDMRAAADEYVAELAEKMNLGELEQSTWDKIVDWLKELLENIGFENLTKEDIESMLKASYSNLRAESGKGKTGSTENDFRARIQENAESKKIFETAKEIFGTTYDMREAGYILPDGTMLDFSGKHQVRGMDNSFLNGGRTVDHREIEDIAYDFDENPTGVSTDMGDFLDRGAIRIDYNVGAINLNTAPTAKQKALLKRLIERNDGDVTIDFGKGWDTEHYAEYESARASRVLGDIDRYYSEGIKPGGNTMFRIAEVQAIEEADKVFNEELDAFKEKSHKGLLHLGSPMRILLSAGVNAEELTLSPTVLFKHLKKQGLTTDDLKGLAKAIQTPILVYEHGENYPNIVVVTELDVKGGKLSIALELDNAGNVVEVSNVSSVHSKDAVKELERLSVLDEGTLNRNLRWVEKEKVSEWLGLPYEEERQDANPKLVSVANVINNFENPTVESENSSENSQDAESGIRFRTKPMTKEEARQMVRELVVPFAKELREEQESVMQGQTMFRITDADRQALEFKRQHRGSANIVVIDTDALTAELVVYGFTADEIQDIREKYEKGALGFYDRDRNTIYLLGKDHSRRRNNATFWHENTHKAIQDLDIPQEVMDEFYAIPSKRFIDFFEKKAKEFYGPEEYAEELIAYFVEDVQSSGSYDNVTKVGTSAEGMERLKEIVEPIINYINHGRRVNEGTEGNHRTVVRGTLRDINAEADQERTRTETEGAGTKETRFRTVEEGTDGSIDDIQTQPLTLMERITNSLLEVSAKNKENLGLRADALRAFGRDINSLLSLMKAQREYDKSTVDTLVKLAKMYFKNAQLLGEVTPYEVARIMGVLNRSVGKRDISTEAARLMDILLDAHTNALAGILDKAEKVKAKKVNAAGVEVMGRLDKYGQKRVDEYRAAKEMTPEKLEEAIYDSDNRLAELEQRVREELGLPEGDVDQAARDYTGDNDVVNVYMDERARLEGLTLAREYKESIQQVQEEIKDLKRELKQAEEDYRLGNIDGKSLKEFRKSVAEAIMESKAELIEGYHSLIYKFQENTKESSKRAKAFAQAQIDRAREIQHNANSDMEGISAATQGTHPENYNNAVMNALRSPFPTFQGMLKKFGEKNVEGKGYLYERFIPQATKASDNEFRGKVTARVMIEGKLKEIYGKEMSIAKFMKQLREYGATVTYREGNEMKQFDLTKGQMLYIYMVNKMSDGQMKLRRMGITDDVVTELMTKLPEEAVQFADWAQNELLKDLRGKYNAVHERVFGAPMAAIENYFPIKIRKEARGEKGDVSEVGQEGKPSTVTGSIIKRTKNATAIDLSADAMQVLMEHIDDMEHWAAFAEFNRDLNVLLNYKHFQNQVKNMTSVRYGSGTELWKNFQKTAQIVSGTYRPSDSSIDRAVQNIAKGLTRSKINFRFYTAAKQLLSAPAFWTDAGVEELAYCYVNPKGSFKWAKENLPGFAERWQGRTMGNEKLLKSDSDWELWRNEFVEAATRWGMTPNAAIDALTVAQGARAVYMTKLEQFKKAGYTEQRANEKALQAAAEAYNESQQSSEGIYLSPLQVEGTVASAIFSTFKNSNFGYTRKTAQAIANIKRKMRKGYKEETIAFMTKQMIRDGLSDENAKRMAEKVYNKSKYRDVANVAMFGFGLNLLWEAGGMAIYLFFGDDDEEKEKMKKEIALRGSLGLLNGIPFGETMISAAMAVKEGDTKYFRLPELVAVSDIKNLAQVLNYDPVRGANDIVNMLTSMGVGVTPQVLTDILVAFGDVEEFSAEELGMFVARLVNAPQSNLDRLMVDDAMENSAVNAEEIMRRYAEYKKSKNAPITQFFYPDEIEQKAIERYAKRFKKLLDERLENVVEDNDAYNLFYEDADARMKSTLAKMRQKYLAEDKAKVFEKLDNKELVDRVFYGKQDINEHYFGMTNAEDEDTAFIIRSVRKKLEDLKEGGKLSDKEQGLLSSLNSLNYAISRAKKLMEQEPERAQEHMTAIREMRAEAIELINKYSNE